MTSENKLWNQALRLPRPGLGPGGSDADESFAIKPPHKLYEVLCGAVAHLRKDPPGENWDGVMEFETK
jgi:hypothetical protein